MSQLKGKETIDQGNRVEIIRRMFEQVEIDFRHLVGSIEPMPFPQVDLRLEFKSQPGLPFPVVATLQGDELGLGAGEGFWCEWFPCGDSEVRERFADAVRGVLSGQHRIVEYRRRERIVKAQLQRKAAKGWETFATWSLARFPLMFGLKMSTLQNLSLTQG
jgi:hypothetical protein